jgi:hypothetical protein
MSKNGLIRAIRDADDVLDPLAIHERVGWAERLYFWTLILGPTFHGRLHPRSELRAGKPRCRCAGLRRVSMNRSIDQGSPVG